MIKTLGNYILQTTLSCALIAGGQIFTIFALKGVAFITSQTIKDVPIIALIFGVLLTVYLVLFVLAYMFKGVSALLAIMWFGGNTKLTLQRFLSNMVEACTLKPYRRILMMLIGDN